MVPDSCRSQQMVPPDIILINKLCNKMLIKATAIKVTLF